MRLSWGVDGEGNSALHWEGSNVIIFHGINGTTGKELIYIYEEFAA